MIIRGEATTNCLHLSVLGAKSETEWPLSYAQSIRSYTLVFMSTYFGQAICVWYQVITTCVTRALVEEFLAQKVILSGHTVLSCQQIVFVLLDKRYST